MVKKSQATGEAVEDGLPQDNADQTKKAPSEPSVKFTGAFNGDRLSFEVQGVGQPAELVVELNGTPWGRAALREPLTVVAGPLLPASWGIEFNVQPINQ